MTASKGVGSPTRHAYLARIQNRANYLPVDLTRIAKALHKALAMAEAAGRLGQNHQA